MRGPTDGAAAAAGESSPGGAAETQVRRGWVVRLAALERAFNARAASPAVRRWLLPFAIVLFVVVSVFSFRSLPDDLHFRWWIAPILILVTTPLTIGVNAAEYRLMGRMSGHRIGWFDSARLTILAGAANLLPLPGGIVIRTQALRMQGSSYKRALAANAVGGVTWLGVGALAIGCMFLPHADRRIAGLLLLLIGLGCLAGVLYVLRRADRARAWRLLWDFVVVEAATVSVNGVRTYLAFQLIGLSATPAQAIALTASVIVAAAIGIFPAGLGIRELIAGAVGAAVSLPVAQSVAATASDRVTAQIGLAIFAAALFWHERRSRAAEPADDVPSIIEGEASATR